MTDDQREYEQIERLAYQLWEQRGCPIGSPGEDWLSAEESVRRERAAVSGSAAIVLSPGRERSQRSRRKSVATAHA